MVFNLKDYDTSRQIEDAIWAADFQGGATGTADGIQAARASFSVAMGDRPGVQNVLVWITDGVSNIDKHRTGPEARMAKDAGINIIAIGVGWNIVTDELKIVASPPAKLNVMKIDHISAVKGILPSLTGGVCKGITTLFFYFNND